MNYNLLFSESLTELMAEFDVNQIELGNATGIAPSSISRWLSGRQTPNLKRLVQLAKFFNCTVDFLAGRNYISEKPVGETCFPEKLKFMIKRAGLSYRDMGEKLGTVSSQICKWTTGESSPSLIAFWNLADFFDCSMDYLLSFYDKDFEDRTETPE